MKFSSEPPTAALFFVGKSRRRDQKFSSFEIKNLKFRSRYHKNFDRDHKFFCDRWAPLGMVWGTRGLHPGFSWFSSFSWFPCDFRESSTQHLLFVAVDRDQKKFDRDQIFLIVGPSGKCGNHPPIDDRNPIRKFSIDRPDASQTND